jgi:hypothetical protein
MSKELIGPAGSMGFFLFCFPVMLSLKNVSGFFPTLL